MFAQKLEYRRRQRMEACHESNATREWVHTPLIHYGEQSTSVSQGLGPVCAQPYDLAWVATQPFRQFSRFGGPSYSTHAFEWN